VAADRARSEASVQALCGLMEVHGRDRDSPSRLGLKVASVAAGLLAAQATQRCTLAELRRVASGSGVSLTPLRGYTEVLAEAPTCRRRRCAQGTASDRPTPASWRTGAEPTAGGDLPLAGVRVVDAGVVGLPHPVLGEDVAAAVVVRSVTSERELQDVVRARLAEHKVPHRVVLVDHLPRNTSGKVVKAEVRALLAAAAPAAGFAGARTETEAVVVSVWAAVLGLSHVGVHDDFFALGGHSLAAAQIAARLRDAFAVDVPVAAVFESPTPAELARVVDDAVTGERAE